MPTEQNSSKDETSKTVLFGSRLRLPILIGVIVVAVLLDTIRPGTAGVIVNVIKSIKAVVSF